MEFSSDYPELNSWRKNGTTLTINNQSYFYRESGEGEALLMVHGFPTSSWDWKDVFDPLAKRFQVIAPDMLGFGFSDKPKRGDYSTKAHAHFHAALLEDRGIQDVHILTYSAGSSVVQQMMSDTLTGVSPLNIRSVSFLNGGLFPGSNRPNRNQRLLLSPLAPVLARLMGKSALAKGFRSIFGPDTQPSAQLIDQYWALLTLNGGRLRIPQTIGYLRDRSDFADEWQRALTEHSAAQQLIVGMTDSISGPAVAEEYRQTVPNAHVIELANIGHYPQIEAPAQVIDAVLEFTG